MYSYFAAVFVLLLTLLAHYEGIVKVYYLSIPAYDIFMHVLGGIGIGLFLSAILHSFWPHLLRRKRAIILGVFIFGLAWESFEVYADITGYHFGTLPYFLDTAKDLLDDVIGGAVIAFFWKMRE